MRDLETARNISVGEETERESRKRGKRERERERERRRRKRGKRKRERERREVLLNKDKWTDIGRTRYVVIKITAKLCKL